MTTQERTEFLAARKLGIGGSDVASLLAEDVEVKYGCKRRLWLDKSGVEPNFADEESGPMRLGKILEPYIRTDYSTHTGNNSQALNQALVYPGKPMVRVNLDGVIYFQDGRLGIHEIKCMGDRMYFETKREGTPVDYILQTQNGILVAGKHYKNIETGVFTIASPARFADPPISWDIAPNKDIHEAILRKGPEFWDTLGDEARAPERLEPDDKRCQKCRWRVTCQGNALIHVGQESELPVDEAMRPLLSEYDERLALWEEADELLDETADEMKDLIGDRPGVAVPWPGRKKPRNIFYREQDGPTLLKKEELMKQYEVMRLKLIQIEESATLIPEAKSFQYKGKKSRPFRPY